MASRNTVRKKQYTLLWSALLWTSFSFWIHRFQFSLRMGLRCARFAGADALLKRRKSGKDKKYLCKLENTDKSIFSSVKPIFKRDIQDIFNRLLHFHERQMDQRLGFSVTELSFDFEVWWMGTISFSFEKYLYMCAWKWCTLGEWRIVSRPSCSYANLYFSAIISIRRQDQDKRGLYQNKVNLGFTLNWRVGY